jgi:hypothetical protein
MKLDIDEFIEIKIEHKKHMPFYLGDWLRVFIFIGISIAGIAAIRSEGIFSVGPVLFGMGIFGIILPMFLRWREVNITDYIISNKRLIFYNNNKKTIKSSFYFDDFPPITFHENAYNSGFISIGDVEPIIVTTKRVGLPSSGINSVNSEYVIYNLPNVRNVYEEISSRIIRKLTED